MPAFVDLKLERMHFAFDFNQIPECSIHLVENFCIGMAQIEELLAREALRLGSDFDLGVFHDTFLSKGMIPIALIGWEMSGDDEAYAWLLPD